MIEFISLFYVSHKIVESQLDDAAVVALSIKVKLFELIKVIQKIFFAIVTEQRKVDLAIHFEAFNSDFLFLLT